jgi:MFS family permease
LIGRRRVAVSIAFLAFGAAGGSWVPRLPALKDHLHLSDSQVGYSLLFFSVGAVLGATAARFILARGARIFVRAGTVGLCAALVAPALATNVAGLLAGFLLIGIASGFLDVLENAQAAELERLDGRPLINGFHAFWSLGAIIGSVAAGIAAYGGVIPLTHLAVAAVLISATSAWFLRDLPDTRSGAAQVAPAGAGRLWLTGSVVAVAAIAFCGFLVEGGSADWSALYLRELSHANPGIAAAGFAGFSVAAMLTRFRADFLTARTSPKTVARLGALVAAGGLALAIAFPALPGAVIGFALVGVGTAVLLPLAFGAGANLSASGTALTVVMSSGYAGSIVGPAIIGNAADRFGLRVAMAVPLLAALGIAALAGNLRVAPKGSEASLAIADQAPGRKG